MQNVIPSLASLCETDSPDTPEGENLAITRNLPGNHQPLSPTACGRSPLPEGAKKILLPQ